MSRQSKWQKDIEIYSSLFSTIIITGNIHDMCVEGDDIFDSLCEYLENLFLNKLGYKTVRRYNRIDKFGDCGKDNRTLLDDIKECRNEINNETESNVTIIDLASELVNQSESLNDSEMEIFTTLFLASKESKHAQDDMGGTFEYSNKIVLLADKISDIPTWFYVNNPNVKTINISRPNRKEREDYIESFNIQDNSLNKENALKETAAYMEGFSYKEMFGVVELFNSKRNVIANLKDAINLYKHGKQEVFWDEETIQGAEKYFNERVMGQEKAIEHTVCVLQRAASGLSNIQTSAIGHPKGVLFFAGPTGTGKTELAKAIAQKIFGDENLLIRFDMSEYSQEHSDQRLIGAPPGYVGYEEGGQLTNAVKNNPFCILLFDEIEKAAPRVLDKFLQILDDGRLTDSAGETVYFSECLIIFTSNLGMNVIRENVDYEKINLLIDSYDELERKFKKNINTYFIKEINRPELLNRFGGNIVVFNSIKGASAANILNDKLNKIIERVYRLKGIKICVSNNVKEYLLDLVQREENIVFGGRGIVNTLEDNVVNPIARCISSNAGILDSNSNIYIDVVNNRIKCTLNS